MISTNAPIHPTPYFVPNNSEIAQENPISNDNNSRVNQAAQPSIEKYSNELDAHKQRAQNLNKDVIDLKSRVEKFKNEKELLSIENEELKSENKKLEQKVDSLQETVKVLLKRMQEIENRPTPVPQVVPAPAPQITNVYHVHCNHIDKSTLDKVIIVGSGVIGGAAAGTLCGAVGAEIGLAVGVAIAGPAGGGAGAVVGLVIGALAGSAGGAKAGSKVADTIITHAKGLKK
jgi:FtsZ-binding cell division protein ZapB